MFIMRSKRSQANPHIRVSRAFLACCLLSFSAANSAQNPQQKTNECQSPGVAGPLLHLAIDAARTDQARCAEWYFLQASQANPTDWSIRHNHAIFRLKRGDRPGAKRILRELAGVPASGAGPVTTLAVLEYEDKELDAAAAHLRMATNRDPASSAAWTTLGALELDRKNYLEAVRCFRQGARLEPNNAQAWLNLGIALAEAGDLTAAADAFFRAYRVAPAEATTNYNYGRALVGLRKFAEAQPFLKTAIDGAPSSGHAHYLLGICRRELGDAAGALHSIEQAIQLDPNSGRYRYELAVALWDLNKESQAVVQWKEALRLDPGLEEATYRLSRALASTDPDAARRFAALFEQRRNEKAVRNQVEQLERMADLALRAGAASDARSHLQRAIEVCGGCPARDRLRDRLAGHATPAR